MLKEIEKNDVDISKLFNWGEKFTITNTNGKKLSDIYIRLVGDAEWNRARTKALRASAELRKSLKDKKSDEHLAFIPVYSELTKEKIIEMVLSMEVRDIAEEVARTLEIPFPKDLPSDASLEEQEEYQKEIDDYPSKREEAINKAITDKLEKERKRLSALSKKKLEELHTLLLTNTICELELAKVFYEYCTYYGSYKDENFSERAFKSFEQFRNLPPNIKDQLIQFYKSLEIGTPELKK